MKHHHDIKIRRLDHQQIEAIATLLEHYQRTQEQHYLDEIFSQIGGVQAADLADLLKNLSPKLAATLLTYLPRRAYVFSYLKPKKQVKIAKALAPSIFAEILGEMHSDERTDVYQHLDPEHQQALLPVLAQAYREDIKRLSSYPQGSAGAIMSADYATLTAEMTVVDAIKCLREEAPDADTIYMAYVVDQDYKLVGEVSLKTLILSQEQQLIQNIMTSDGLYAYVDTDQDEVAKTIARYDLIALPIVDNDGFLMGIVTYDDAMEIATAEVTEDFLKSSAMEAAIKSVKETSILILYRNRVVWLVVLVFGSLLSGFGIAHFEDIIAAHIALVFFLPLLVGSGGNAGSQSATLMVRALATGDVEPKDWFFMLGRETLVALCLGATMACAVSILGYFRADIMVSLVLAISMMGIVMMGCLIGMSLPFILNKLNLDPASASAPLVTSICDATGVVLYLFVASQILSL